MNHFPIYRKAWVALEEMTKEDARMEIIKLLESVDTHMKDTVLERWRAKQSGEEKDKPRYAYVTSQACGMCGCEYSMFICTALLV